MYKYDNVNERVEELVSALKGTNNKRLYIRYQAMILLLRDGKTSDEISAITGKSTASINRYKQNYRKKGVMGLTPAKPSGRHADLTPAQQAELKDIILTKTPEEMGFPAQMNWIVRFVRQLIIDLYSVEMCPSAVHAMLVRNRMSYTRPTYCLANADKDKQDDFKKNSSGSNQPTRR